MKPFIAIVLTLSACSILMAEEGRRKIGDPPASAGTGELYVTPSFNNRPGTLKDLVQMASVIVRASVMRALPAREPEPGKSGDRCGCQGHGYVKGPGQRTRPDCLSGWRGEGEPTYNANAVFTPSAW
jgi:hypothetical protein